MGKSRESTKRLPGSVYSVSEEIGDLAYPLPLDIRDSESCKKAVDEDPGYGSAQDSLAVARALTLASDPKKDDIELIIKGFETYIKWAKGKREPSRIDRRNKWIGEFRNDKNPFNKAHRAKTLQELKYE
jgi:hypothetical protein